MARSISELAVISNSTKVYLAELAIPPLGGSSEPAHEFFAKFLGLPTHAAPTADGKKALPAKLYRFLGTDPQELDHDSLMVCSLALPMTKEVELSKNDDVVSTLLPFGVDVPYVELFYGHSMISTTRPLSLDPLGWPFKTRVRLNIANQTGKDLWLTWGQQVEGSAQRDYVWNGREVGHDSQPISWFKDVANFTIEVYANDNGKPGKYLGHFNYGVSTADRSASLRLVAAKTQSGNYSIMDLQYISPEQGARPIAQVPLDEWTSSTPALSGSIA